MRGSSFLELDPALGLRLKGPCFSSCFLGGGPPGKEALIFGSPVLAVFIIFRVANPIGEVDFAEGDFGEVDFGEASFW